MGEIERRVNLIDLKKINILMPQATNDFFWAKEPDKISGRSKVESIDRRLNKPEEMNGLNTIKRKLEKIEKQN